MKVTDMQEGLYLISFEKKENHQLLYDFFEKMCRRGNLNFDKEKFKKYAYKLKLEINYDN